MSSVSVIALTYWRIWTLESLNDNNPWLQLTNSEPASPPQSNFKMLTAIEEGRGQSIHRHPLSNYSRMWSAAFSLVRHTEFIDWRWPISCVHSIMLVFSTSFGIFVLSPVAPLPFSWLPPPPPSLCQSTVHTGSVWLGEVGGVGDHIMQEFSTLYLTRFRT